MRLGQKHTQTSKKASFWFSALFLVLLSENISLFGKAEVVKSSCCYLVVGKDPLVELRALEVWVGADDASEGDDSSGHFGDIFSLKKVHRAKEIIMGNSKILGYFEELVDVFHQQVSAAAGCELVNEAKTV